MKSYYELKEKEVKNYEKEFRKTPGGSKSYTNYMILNVVSKLLFVFYIVVFIYTILANNTDNSNFNFYIGIIAVLILIVAAIVGNEYYYGKAFSSWLEIKHEIKK